MESNQLKETGLAALVNARNNAEVLSAEFSESKEKIDKLTEAVGVLSLLKSNSQAENL